MTTRCSQCASDLAEAATACAKCGAPAGSLQSQSTRDEEDAESSQSGLVPAFAGTVAGTSEETSAPFSEPFLHTDSHLEGLGGWLILVGLGLVISPLVILGTTVSDNVPLLTNSDSRAFLESHPALEGLIVFEVVTNVIFVVILGALNILFFTRKRSFPTYMILYLAFQVILLSGDALAVRAVMPSVHTPASYSAITRSFLGAAMWIPYLLLSRRVKATFVH